MLMLIVLCALIDGYSINVPVASQELYAVTRFSCVCLVDFITYTLAIRFHELIKTLPYSACPSRLNPYQ